MKIQFSVPSKTFLVGEYIALEGAPAILLATEPRFHVVVERPGEGLCEGVNPKSPSGHLVLEHSAAFRKINFKFLDPHMGAGGFGASGAQFLCAYLWNRIAVDGLKTQTDFNDLIKEIWRTFKLVISDRGEKASGYDLISQFTGGLKLISSHPWEIRDLNWNFSTESLLLFRTGVKVQTHHHLETTPQIPSYDLRQFVHKVELGLVNSSVADVADGLNRYQEQLFKLGLLHPQVKPLREGLAKVSGVHAVKGCGAFGSDVVLVFCQNEAVEAVKTKAVEMGMTFAASHKDVSSGIDIAMTSLNLGSGVEL